VSPLAALMAREVAEVAREAQALAEPALRRASLAVVAALLATAGAGFLLSAAYLGLARHLGPEGAGLILGAALLACGAVLYLYARGKRPGQVPAAARPDRPPAAPAEGELAPLAAFAAAFVLARQLRRRRAR
jgi:hypothetical protein